MNNAKILFHLSSLTDKQFAEFFYEAVADRDTADFESENGHFVLATTGQFPGEERDTVFIAVPDLKRHPGEWAHDSPICQTGHCAECNSSVRSIAKNAICPICDAEVYCT